jgi:hypothetical protein
MFTTNGQLTDEKTKKRLQEFLAGFAASVQSSA